MEINFIEITKENYQDYLNLDIVAFSYAFGGAMGEGGGVIITTSDGKWYHTNYAWGDFPHELLPKTIPVLENCEFTIFGYGSQAPEGWFYENLGMGNHLVVREDLHEAFDSKKGDDATPPFMYQHWQGYVKDILDN